MNEIGFKTGKAFTVREMLHQLLKLGVNLDTPVWVEVHPLKGQDEGLPLVLPMQRITQYLKADDHGDGDFLILHGIQ